MQKNNESLSPRDIELLEEKAKLEIKTKDIAIDDGRLIEKNHTNPRDSSLKSKHRDISYKKTMSHIRTEMPVLNRLFSRFIHSSITESLLNFLGYTIFRPNSILLGSISAFLIGSFFYIFARQYGYILSGTEIATSFVLGWMIGIVYDLLKAMITGKNNS